MKTIILSLILIICAAFQSEIGAQDEPQNVSNKEQRKIKKQQGIQYALELLQSGQFDVVKPTFFEDPIMGLITELDSSNPNYQVSLSELDSVKNIYTVLYHRNAKTGVDCNVKVTLYIKTGYVRIDKYFDSGHVGPITADYTYIRPFGK